MTPKIEKIPPLKSTHKIRRCDGNLKPIVILEFHVPSRVAALLEDHDGWYSIPSAVIGTAEMVGKRATTWKCGLGRGSTKTRPKRDYTEIARREGCDTAIKVWLHPEEWHRVGLLCGKVGITPGEWFAASATYNAAIQEEAHPKIVPFPFPFPATP